ncbi:MAG TPA: hypothetical protein PKA93_04235 [Arachnia sp.]|nr:hypothetical protein [Arachnia sp.]
MYYRDPDLKDWQPLANVTTGLETGRAMDGIMAAREMNLMQRGEAIFRNVEIGKPKTDAEGIRSAVVSYCHDPSQLDVVDVSTGDPVQRTKTLAARVTMQLFPDESWRAARDTSEFEPC